MKLVYAFAFLSSIILAQPAFADSYALEEDLGVDNGQRYCRYSNGGTYTISEGNECAPEVEDDAPSEQQASAPSQQRALLPGFLLQQTQDSQSIVCIYNLMGSNVHTRINFGGLCPQRQDF